MVNDIKNVLVYPCGTEIALEIYNSISCSIHYNVIGGSSSCDHGRFVFKNHIDNLPFVTDNSSETEIDNFISAIEKYNIDMIYPAMDGVLTSFSKYKNKFKQVIVAPDFYTADITRSKKNTYKMFDGLIPLPYIYDDNNINTFPIFVKPNIGQGSKGAILISNISELNLYKSTHDDYLCLEYLSGAEYTVDCFTNNSGELVYCNGRMRKRIKNGISVNSYFILNDKFKEYAEIINNKLQQRGGWFFQLKEASDKKLKLLEISSRIAGSSSINRAIGVNLPLATLDSYCGILIDDFCINNYNVEVDRALDSKYKIYLYYNKVYIDYDDTVVMNGKLNLDIIKFLYQCVNNKIKIFLITKHEGDLMAELKKYKISNLFDEVLHIGNSDNKISYICEKNNDFIYIDDSYNERKNVYKKFNVNVFDSHMISVLLEG